MSTGSSMLFKKKGSLEIMPTVPFMHRASHIISDYLYALQTKIRTLYLKNLVFSSRKLLQWPYTIF